MSIKWISYIWDKTDYRDGSALVALALADFSNDEGVCHPKMATVAKKARLSVRQVQRIIKAFEIDGFLEVVRNDGRGKEPVFQLKRVTSVTPFADRKRVTSVTIKGDICDIKRVTSVTLPIYKEEPLIEPLKNRVENAHSLAVAAVIEIFCFTPSIYSQEAIDASEIKDLNLWRRVLTEKKAQIGAAEWNNHNYRQKQVGYCLANYRQALDRQPVKSSAENLFFDISKFQLKTYRPQ
jgi:hypothetical protein